MNEATMHPEPAAAPNAESTIRFFDALSEKWESELEPCGAKHAATAFLAQACEGATVLDIGCGTGIMAQAYLDAGASRILGIDIAPQMIAIAQRKFEGNDRVEFLAADIYGLETDMRFDSVVVYNAYPHFINKEALARKVAELLVPGGRFLVAHGMSRHAINEHHGCVPAEVCTHLESAADCSKDWQPLFDIDECIDTDRYFCFGGTLRR